MPLSCDCFDGCWDVHSLGWPVLTIHKGVNTAQLAATARIPYGSYVKVGTQFRCETDEYFAVARRVLEDRAWISTTPHIM